MNLKWTEVGKKHVSEEMRPDVEKKLKAMEWIAVPCSFPAMPALAIQCMITDLALGRALEVGYDHFLAPLGVVSVHARRKTQEVRMFAVDAGDCITPLAYEILDLPPEIVEEEARIRAREKEKENA